jgi:hypothetical protein
MHTCKKFLNRGLRERKRVETRRRIAAETLRLVTDRGLDEATVEGISASAGVSVRTFFNYFESKDDALINGPDPRDRSPMSCATSPISGVSAPGRTRGGPTSWPWLRLPPCARPCWTPTAGGDLTSPDHLEADANALLDTAWENLK